MTDTLEKRPADARFDSIREGFPFPLGRVFQPTLDFAEVRISRLAPGGRWYVATESAEFATTLEAAVASLEVDVMGRAPPLVHE